jgi:phosphatidylcholine synthase
MDAPESPFRPSPPRLAAAWAVHAFTASGALWGLLSVIAVGQGRFKEAMGWMLLALAVDSFDGALARLAHVRRVLPGFDGALLDNLLDYVNYALVPAYLLHAAGVFPERGALLGAGAICLASAYQFAQAEAKTADHTFTGFPSYWNVVAFYLLMLRWPPGLALATVLVLCVLCFVPLRYLYPSRVAGFRALHVGTGLVWGCLLVYLLARWPDSPLPLVWASLAYIVYYFAVSFVLTARRRASIAAQRMSEANS